MQRIQKRDVPEEKLREYGGYIISSIVDMIYPPRCPLCERILAHHEELICPECARTLLLVQEPKCMKCGKPIGNPEKEYCADCERHPHQFEEGRSALLYERGARGAVDRLKFYNKREYVPFFGMVLENLAVETFFRWRPECLVPVPMHPRKKAERGFDQAALLAEELGRRTGVPVREDILERTRYTKASKRLGKAGRRRNLRGAFSVRCKPAGEDRMIPAGNTAAAKGGRLPDRVVLIDDIYTTGATMDEAAYALQKAGVGHVFFLTVCIGRGQS